MSDLISRQWLMECMNEGWIKFNTEKDENRFIHLVRDIAPSVQPEIKTDGDTISRAEAVKAICGDCVWYNTASCEGEEWECDSVNKLRSLPSAETHEIRTQTHAMRSDTISRADAIYAIVNTVSDVGLHDNSETARYGATYRQQEIITILKSLPSANKSGHWMMNPSEVAGDGYYICSNCNNDVYDATDFCPNCGSYNGGERDDKG